MTSAPLRAAATAAARPAEPPPTTSTSGRATTGTRACGRATWSPESSARVGLPLRPNGYALDAGPGGIDDRRGPEGLQLPDHKPRLLHELGRITVKLAAGAEPTPDGIEGVLEEGSKGVVVADVL